MTFVTFGWLQDFDIERPKVVMTGFIMILTVSIVIMGATLRISIYQLTTMFAMTIGISIYSLFTLSMIHFLRVMEKNPKIKEHSFLILALALTLGGAFGALVTGFGDFVHYMNRDITYWIYACESFIWVMMVIGYFLQLCLVRY